MMLCRFAVAWIISLMLTSVVAAAPPLKALIVNGQNNHNWKETTPCLKKHLEKTGIFTVDVATSPAQGEDMSPFKPNFAAYDAVVSNYTGDAWPAETQEALDEYVRGGGGLVIFHAANNAFPQWKQYNKMIGVGGWGGRSEKDGPYLRWRDGKIVRDTTPGRGGSHGPQHEYQIVVREPDHPITRGLPKVFMHCADELYNRLRGPAEDLTVLATAYSPKDQRGTGEHEPQLMTIAYGQGRVFHIAYGHAAKQCQSVAFIVPFQRGTEWAATGKVTQRVPQDFPGADEPSVRK